MAKVFIDTAPFIYYLERSDYLMKAVQDRFTFWISQRDIIVSSVVTLTELLIQPRKQNNAGQYQHYVNILHNICAKPLFTLDEDAALLAVDYRVKYGFTTVDSFQLAIAYMAGCEIFYTNDKQLLQFDGMNVELVEV